MDPTTTGAIEPELRKLWEQLVRLQAALQKHTRENYQRINPFAEDLFDWKSRGNYWCGEDRNITIYNSVTVAGDVTIGDNTWVGPFCILDGTGGLSIGRYCTVTAGCQLLTHDTLRWALTGGKSPPERAPTRIGDMCFLGAKAIVTKGVRIGNHSVVAAGAVVTKDVAPFSIVGGVPAKRIGSVKIDPDGKVTLSREVSG